MAVKIDDKIIEYVGILAKLNLSEEEKKKAGEDMSRMLEYIDKLNELDTRGTAPVSYTHLFPQLFIQLLHKSRDTGPQGAEVVIVHLLALGGRRAE